MINIFMQLTPKVEDLEREMRDYNARQPHIRLPTLLHKKSFLEFRLGRTLAVSLRLTEPSYILIEAMPQRWNSLGIA
jgi:hypothetical protein